MTPSAGSVYAVVPRTRSHEWDTLQATSDLENEDLAFLIFQSYGKP
jgi:hypothetical protein